MTPRNYWTHTWISMADSSHMLPSVHQTWFAGDFIFPLNRQFLMGAMFDCQWTFKLTRSIHIPILFPPTPPFLLVKSGHFPAIPRHIEPSIFSPQRIPRTHRTIDLFWNMLSTMNKKNRISVAGLFFDRDWLGGLQWLQLLWKKTWGMHQFIADLCGEYHHWLWHFEVFSDPAFNEMQHFTDGVDIRLSTFGRWVRRKMEIPQFQIPFVFPLKQTTCDISSYLNGQAQMVKCTPLTS